MCVFVSRSSVSATELQSVFLHLCHLFSAACCASLLTLSIVVLLSLCLSFFLCLLLSALVFTCSCLYVYSLFICVHIVYMCTHCLYVYSLHIVYMCTHCLYVYTYCLCLQIVYMCTLCLYLSSSVFRSAQHSLSLSLSPLFFPVPQRPTHSTPTVPGTGADPEHVASSGSPAEHLRVASDHLSDHSITDSPVHPGKK